MPEKPSHIFYGQETDSIFERKEPSEESIEELEAHRKEAQEILEREIGVVEHDIPISAINSYLRGLGLEQPPLIVFNATYDNILRIGDFDQSTGMAFMGDEQLVGLYSPDLDTAFTCITPDSSTEHRILTTTHELTHGTGLNAHAVFIDEGVPGSYASRSAFAIQKEQMVMGRALDEGRAEMVAGQFLSLGAPDDEGYFSDGLYLPRCYFPEGVGSESESAPAAAALEMLVAKDHDLLDSFLIGAASVDGLRETVQRLNRLQPGLYDRVRKVEEGRETFTELAKYIQGQFFDNQERAPVYAHNIVRDLIGQRLEKSTTYQ